MEARPTTFELWYGRDEPPIEPIGLRAGPVTADLVGRDLRHVRFGGIEVAQRIYVAVRDRNWGTVPGSMSNLETEQGHDTFAVRFDVRHAQHDVDLDWRGEIVGRPDGTIVYAMDAVAGRDLTYKLVGLNVHHGMHQYAGRPYEGRTPQGPLVGAFPTLVEPQFVVDQTEVPIFPAVERLTVHLASGVAVRFDFEGDTFEFEDQRNWTDASFKSQSFPPRRNGFFRMRGGDRLRQAVTISVAGPPPRVAPRGDRIGVAVGEPIGRPLPPIGFGMASHGGALSAREAELLRVLRPDHLRVDLHLDDQTWRAEAVRAIDACRALGCALELALFVTEESGPELDRLSEVLTESEVALARFLLFEEHAQATSAGVLDLARLRLRGVAPGALLVGGTNANFCELNRHRSDPDSADGLVYPITPQVHAFDELSLAENLAASAETLATARAFASDRPIFVGPVTLKPRFNAVATSDEPTTGSDELPPQVDPRQTSLFGAGWTVGSVKALAGAGAAALTYYETTGWRGVIETDAGSPLPDRFPSRPGMVFPIYHIFADLAEWNEGELVALRSDDPLAVEGLAVRVGGSLHLLLANLTPRAQRVRIRPLGDGALTRRRLDAETAASALLQPSRFRTSAEPVEAAEGAVEMVLAPLEIARLDLGRPRRGSP